MIATSAWPNSPLMSSISKTWSYGTSASASSTFMWPGMRPATGWIAYLTVTPFSVSLARQLLDRVLGARDRQAVARHDDHRLGVAEHEGGVVGAAALDRPLLGRRRPAAVAASPPKPPRMTLKNERFIALHMM